jgi:hypothetical protein
MSGQTAQEAEHGVRPLTRYAIACLVSEHSNAVSQFIGEIGDMSIPSHVLMARCTPILASCGPLLDGIVVAGSGCSDAEARERPTLLKMFEALTIAQATLHAHGPETLRQTIFAALSAPSAATESV